MPGLAQTDAQPSLPPPAGVSGQASDDAAIVVTATRSERALEDSPTPVEVVSRKTIAARGVRSMQDAVNTSTGVFVRPGRGIADVQQTISLHGVPDEKRSLVLLDGQTLNDSYAGGLNLSGLPVDMLDRVEVSQGPGSALYGGNAMGGVVHFVTRLPKGPEATLRMGYGDADKKYEAPGSTRWLSMTAGNRFGNGLALIGGLSYRGTHGYPAEWNITSTAPTAGITGATTTTSTTGIRAYLIGDKGVNRWTDYALALRAMLPLSAGSRLSASFMRQAFDYDAGAPHSHLRNAAGNEVFSYTGLQSNSFNASTGAFLRNLVQLGYETSLGGGELKLDLGYARTPRNWFTIIGTTAATDLNGGPGRISQGRSGNWTLDAQWTRDFGTHLLTLGGARRDEFASSDETNLGDWKNIATLTSPSASTRGKAETLALFGQDEWRIGEAATVWLGGRWDRWTTHSGFSWNSLVTNVNGLPRNLNTRSATAFSPKLSAVYRFMPQLAVRASIGKAFRPPSTFELYRVSQIATRTSMNNPDLNPETSKTTDLGLEARPWTGAKLGLGVFRNDFKDLIYLAGAGTIRNRVNAGEARSEGVQWSLEQKFGDVKFFANATRQSGTVLANSIRPESIGKDLTLMPRYLQSVGIEARRGPWNLTATVRHAARQYNTDDNTDGFGVYGSYDAYTVADARLTYQLAQRVELGVGIDNLTNRKYFSFYPAPGRTWSVDMKLSF